MSGNVLRISDVNLLPEPLRTLAQQAISRDNKGFTHVIVGGTQIDKPTLFECARTEQKPKRGDPEHVQQAQFIAELDALAARDVRYALAVKRTFTIANGGFKSKRTRGRHKAEGVKPGVYDLFCQLPVGPFHGLEIEMKSLTGSPSREQIEWGSMSTRLGYCSAVCRGWKQAMTVWLAYVDASL